MVWFAYTWLGLFKKYLSCSRALSFQLHHFGPHFSRLACFTCTTFHYLSLQEDLELTQTFFTKCLFAVHPLLLWSDEDIFPSANSLNQGLSIVPARLFSSGIPACLTIPPLLVFLSALKTLKLPHFISVDKTVVYTPWSSHLSWLIPTISGGKTAVFISIKFWLAISIYLSLLFNFLQCHLQLLPMLFFSPGFHENHLSLSILPDLYLVPVRKEQIVYSQGTFAASAVPATLRIWWDVRVTSSKCIQDTPCAPYLAIP